MTKRLVTYTIQEEKARLAFGAEIHGIDANCIDVISGHAIYFESDKNLDELFQILSATGIDGSVDEFFIFTVTNSGFGIGMKTVLERLKRE
ncbi:MAG: hypothetical protein SFY92_03205 [Verrucomicrobiae bacterium]|nr:hypothetical protein [Verrucomicrobiae bacterium]